MFTILTESLNTFLTDIIAKITIMGVRGKGRETSGLHFSPEHWVSIIFVLPGRLTFWVWIPSNSKSEPEYAVECAAKTAIYMLMKQMGVPYKTNI